MIESLSQGERIEFLYFSFSASLGSLSSWSNGLLLLSEESPQAKASSISWEKSFRSERSKPNSSFSTCLEGRQSIFVVWRQHFDISLCSGKLPAFFQDQTSVLDSIHNPASSTLVAFYIQQQESDAYTSWDLIAKDLVLFSAPTNSLRPSHGLRQPLHIPARVSFKSAVSSPSRSSGWSCPIWLLCCRAHSARRNPPGEWFNHWKRALTLLQSYFLDWVIFVIGMTIIMPFVVLLELFQSICELLTMSHIIFKVERRRYICTGCSPFKRQEKNHI